jgi:hypothetical protein
MQTKSSSMCDKKVYHTPKLRVYGNVKEITSTESIHGGKRDNTGMTPTMYTNS